MCIKSQFVPRGHQFNVFNVHTLFVVSSSQKKGRSCSWYNPMWALDFVILNSSVVRSYLLWGPRFVGECLHENSRRSHFLVCQVTLCPLDCPNTWDKGLFYPVCWVDICSSAVASFYCTIFLCLSSFAIAGFCFCHVVAVIIYWFNLIHYQIVSEYKELSAINDFRSANLFTKNADGWNGDAAAAYSPSLQEIVKLARNKL